MRLGGLALSDPAASPGARTRSAESSPAEQRFRPNHPLQPTGAAIRMPRGRCLPRRPRRLSGVFGETRAGIADGRRRHRCANRL